MLLPCATMYASSFTALAKPKSATLAILVRVTRTFLAARSRCTILCLSKYDIPAAHCGGGGGEICTVG